MLDGNVMPEQLNAIAACGAATAVRMSRGRDVKRIARFSALSREQQRYGAAKRFSIKGTTL